jgi:hypothetical protein
MDLCAGAILVLGILVIAFAAFGAYMWWMLYVEEKRDRGV